MAAEIFSAVLFAFSVPVCMAYSFYARRSAPDRRTALAGFTGAILFGVGYLIMMPQVFYGLICVLAGKEF
jgi:hypothetical protein